MKRFAATLALTAGGVVFLVAGVTAQAQLKERSLSDTPAASAPAPAQTPPPASEPQKPAASSQPGAATVTPVPSPPQGQGTQPGPAPASQPAASHPAQTPPPPPPGSGTPFYTPPQNAPTPPPPPASGGTPINGRTDMTPPPPPPPGGGTPINGNTNVTPPPPPPPLPPTQAQTYSRKEVNREVLGFFESGSRGLAEMVARAFHDLGEPTGFIKGNEAGGALVVGLRYGVGTLYLKGHKPVTVYWQSPSLGLDLGVNAVKVFTLVYGVTNPKEIFQRFPGVDGSAYIIGGFGMNYQRTEGMILAPIRFGVGLRLGANVGYQHYTRTQEINPF